MVSSYGDWADAIPVYRSIDERGPFSVVWGESNAWCHCHGVRHNDDNPGEGVLSFGDDGEDRFLYSDDGGSMLEQRRSLLPTNGVVEIDTSGFDRSHASKHYMKRTKLSIQ